MDKAKKKRLKRALTWAGIAALVALLAVMPLLAKQEAEADGPVASVLSAQVTREDIPQVLRGGGTLEDKGAQEIDLPAGVKITEFLVKNGDAVKSGDPVARVDKVSVMAAITDVAETMEYLREELEEGRNEKIDSVVTATAGGRVKEIFAWPGERVQDVMLRRGALALLSIDGLMAVKLEVASPVTTGESVTVTVGGEEVTGRVESNLSGAVIVTVEDEGYAIGETVTVTQSDGTALGKGELYVHNAWKAVAYSGTVSNVNIRKEQVLSSGATLFTLTDTDYEGQLRRRASQHREYEALLQRLLAMYESGCITAPCDGFVSGVDEDSVHLLAAEEVDAQVTLLDGGGMGTVRLMLLSNVTCKGADPNVADCLAASHIAGCPKFCDGTETCTSTAHNPQCLGRCEENAGCQAINHKTNCIRRCDRAATKEDPCDAAVHYDDCIKSCKTADSEGMCKDKTFPHYEGCIESCKEATSTEGCTATGKHKKACIRACIHADVEKQCKDIAPHYLDCVESCTKGSDCPASKHKLDCELREMTFTARVAKVDYVGNTVLGVFWDSNIYPVVQSNGSWQIATPDFSGQNFLTRGELSVDNPKSFQKGDVVMVITGYKGNDAVWDRTVKYSSGGGGSGKWDLNLNLNLSLDLKGMMGGFAGFGNYSGGAAAQTETLHPLEGSTLMVVTPEEGITVDILLDERDISKVREGMEATIKVEALHGQSFAGTVTKVGSIGEHSGSTGKFTVRVETDFIPESLPGMSSKVTIHLETREDVLTLPVAALVQDGARTVVYTALDAKTGQPAAPKEITTGVSDGETVEVFGLEEGTKVYYLYYDVLEIDHSAEARQFNLN